VKKGKIEFIEEERVMMLNLDGQCREMLAVSPEEASNIKDEIGLGEEVLYFTKGNKLVYIEPAEINSELMDLYEILPKEKGCVLSA